MREACDEAQLHRSAGRRHHDRNRAGGRDRGSDRRGEVGDDDIDAHADQLRRKLRGPIGSFLRVAKLDPDVLTFGVAEALEPAAECIGERMRRRCRHQYADARHFSGLLRRLLRLSGEWPSENAPTYYGDERSPLHYLITWSARSSTECGMVRRSALAVFRLITSSNLVGCSTGRSAGFAPLRILST